MLLKIEIIEKIFIFIFEMKNHINIQWPDGSFLPILLHSDATIKDLKNMLQFAFGPNEILQFSINDSQIINDDDTPMYTYGLKDGDTIHAFVFKPSPFYKGGVNLQKQIDSILLEAAKVIDTHMNQLESANDTSLSEYEPSEPDSNFIVHEQATIIPSKTDKINSSPMPQLFSESDRFETDVSNPQMQNYNTQKPPLFNSIEEAGDYFLDSKTDNEWR